MGKATGRSNRVRSGRRSRVHDQKTLGDAISDEFEGIRLEGGSIDLVVFGDAVQGDGDAWGFVDERHNPGAHRVEAEVLFGLQVEEDGLAAMVLSKNRCIFVALKNR